MLIDAEYKDDFQKEELQKLTEHIKWLISEVRFFKDAPEIWVKALKLRAKELYREL
jgi:hypothetical protein